MEKFVYSLEEKTDRNLLGQKGANLIELYNMHIPVPSSILLTTKAHKNYKENGRITRELEKQILEHLKVIEIKTGKKLGDVQKPLLLSVRESTILEESKNEAIINIGLNDNIAANLAVDENSAKFIYDTYRKLIMMYAKIIKGKNTSPFEILIEKYKEKRNVQNDCELTAEDLFQITSESKKIYRKITGEKFPKDPEHQLLEAVRTIYKTWKDDVAVIIEEMVFGNLNEDSYIGIVFSKDPKTAEDKLTGAFSYQTQEKNENLKSIDTLLEKDITIYQNLEEYAEKLENKYQDIIRISFVVENNKLYILDFKKAKKTSLATLKLASSMLKENIISKEEAINMLNPQKIYSLIYDTLNIKNDKPITKGNGIIPEAIAGKISLGFNNFSKDEKSILIKEKLFPEDIAHINDYDSIITIENNELNKLVTEIGKCHIENIDNLKIDYKNKIIKINNKIYEEGSFLTLDGSTGNIYQGKLEIEKKSENENLSLLLSTAKEIKKMNIITNELPIESLTDGIGIFKIENILFDKEKITYLRKLIFSESAEEKEKTLKDFSVSLTKDIEKVFKISNEKTITIKLLDICFRNFIPKTDREIYELSENLNIELNTLKEKIDDLTKYSPLIDLRGYALAKHYPEIIKLEIETIFKAMLNTSKADYKIKPEIILPKINSNEELKYLKKLIDEVKKNILKDISLSYKLGIIIETPRDTVLASSYAKEVDLMIFNLHKLTCLTYGLESENLIKETIDKEGVGKLMTVASSLSFKVNQNIEFGTLGKFNEDEASLKFFKKIGIKNLYVLPHQLPVTLIAAAKSEINGNK